MLGGGGRRVRGGEPKQVCHTVCAIPIRGLTCKERGGLGGVSKLVFGAVTAGEAATAGTWHAPRSATVMEALGYAPFDEPLVSRRAEAILRSRATRAHRAVAVDESGHGGAGAQFHGPATVPRVRRGHCATTMKPRQPTHDDKRTQSRFQNESMPLSMHKKA